MPHTRNGCHGGAGRRSVGWGLVCVGIAIIATCDGILAFQSVSCPARSSIVHFGVQSDRPHRPITWALRASDNQTSDTIEREKSYRPLLQKLRAFFRKEQRISLAQQDVLRDTSRPGRWKRWYQRIFQNEAIRSTNELPSLVSSETNGTQPDLIPSEAVTSYESDDTPNLVGWGDRWAMSAPNVDLSGKWSLVVSDDFLKEYDTYLTGLGQPFLVRSIALSIIGKTTEETLQTDHGRTLLIRSINARGVWERTLTTSGADAADSTFTAVTTPVWTIDKECVQAEAWWETNGTVHVSWLRGVTKYGGGDFESLRYLQDDQLVCRSIFHAKRLVGPAPPQITWRFRRD